MVVTGRAVIAAVIAAAVVAVIRPTVTAAIIGAAVLAFLLAIDVATAGSVRALTITRRDPAPVRLGSSTTTVLAVTNPGRRRVRGLIRDAWTPSAGAAPARAAIDIPAGHRRLVTTTLTPTRRGNRAADRVTIRTLGPLGLAGRQGSHRVPGSVRALPAFPSRRHLPAMYARVRDLDGRAAMRIRGAGTEFDSLRDYVVGDDTRSIDWRATARRGDVVVRTWRPERDRHVVVVVDTGRTSAGRIGDAPRLDAALDAALLLTAVATRAGDRVSMIGYDREVRARLDRLAPSETLPRMMDVLADLNPSLIETDHRGMVAEVARRTRRHAFVVILTAFDAESTDVGLVPMLRRLTDPHTVLVATVTDPALDRLATARGDVAAVHAAAAAEVERRQRAHSEELVRREGAHVVTAGPDDLAVTVTDTYLTLKATGRL